jgi:hypothetical protein
MAKKKDELTNPITSRPPNSFTQVTNRQLPAPANVREQAPLPAGDRKRLRKLHTDATGPGGFNEPATGYGQTGGMSDASHAWVTGAHHMFPNQAAERGQPAINEPHEAHPGVTVQRRAEDLSGKEYRKGTAVLANYGHDPRDPVGSLIGVQRQALHRVIGEHAAAGVEENASQHFYGGAPIQTRIPDQHLQDTHSDNVLAAHARFVQGVDRIAGHPDFQPHTAGMSHGERLTAATNIMGQATADTSPNNRWRTTNHWPNLDQAEESATAAISAREPKFIGGRIQNVHKAAARVQEMANSGGDGGGWGEGTNGQAANSAEGERFAPHKYGDPRSSAKTVAFRGALVEPNAADAYKVSDVHEAGNMLPGVSTRKGLFYRDKDDSRVTHFADQPASHVRGMTPEHDERTGRQARGNARAEDMLAAGKSTVHALNDYATRNVLASHGLSRGVNYADNVHAVQAATWGSQQARRTDPQMADVSHASQYPVVRDWGSEGHDELNEHGQALFGGHRSLGPQFRENPNTSGIKNIGRQPYPLA